MISNEKSTMPNSMIDLLQAHRSVRSFTDKVIPEELLQQLIIAGQSASTSSHAQATSIIRVKNRELRNQLAVLADNQQYISEAPEFLVFCADLQRIIHCFNTHQVSINSGTMEQFIVGTVDTALLAQNIAIAAESYGLGICYIGALRSNPDQVSQLLNLPQYVYPVFGMCLGYSAKVNRTKPRLPLETVLMTDTYQAVDKEQIKAYDRVMQNHYNQRKEIKSDRTWSQNIAEKMGKKSRPHMKKFLDNQGFKFD